MTDHQFYVSESDQAQTDDPSMRPDIFPFTIAYLERVCDDFNDYGVYNKYGELVV